jgi:hypothetical protein
LWPAASRRYQKLISACVAFSPLLFFRVLLGLLGLALLLVAGGAAIPISDCQAVQNQRHAAHLRVRSADWGSAEISDTLRGSMCNPFSRVLLDGHHPGAGYAAMKC